MTSISAGDWSERARDLKADGWWLADLCGIDRLRIGRAEERFGVVIQLLHHERKERQTVHVTAVGDPPTVPSVVSLWPAVDFMEREAFDMFGIVFEGHPNLKRILMPEEWEGYPLRKDYGVGKVAVEFIEQPLLQLSTPGQGTDRSESKVHVDRLGQVVEEGDAP